MQLFINNWFAVLTAPATASAVSLSVPLADAAKLTGLGAGDYYLLTLAALDGAGIETAWEIVKVTASASGVLTVQRGQEGTAARDWVSASVISARATKGTLEALRAGSGAIVGNAAPQPLGPPAAGIASTASREDHVHAKPTAADIGAATAAQGAKADTAVQPAALASSLAGKVDKDGAKVLSDQNYTAAEKAKLAGLEAAHFKGLHASLAALQAAHPSAVAGDYADVDSGAGADVARYIWDVSDSAWIIQSGASGSMTAAQIKTAYESNPDTNAFSDTEQAKLGAIAAGATANATDAQLRDRSTHSGTQAASTISDLAAAVRGVVMTGVSFVTATAGLATDSLLVFLGKLQAQVTSLVTTVAGKQDTLVSGTTLKTVNGSSLLGAGDLSIAGGGASLPVIRSITGNETLGLTSINTFGVNSTVSNYTSTIPAQATVAWTADAELHFLPSNTGDITVTAASGVSLNGVVAGSLTLSTQNGAASLKRTGADSWWLGGVVGTTAEQRTALGLGTAALADLTASGTDVTVGRVLKVGDFALPLNSDYLALPKPGNTDGVTDLNTITTAGWYGKLLGGAPGSRPANFPTGQTGQINYVYLFVTAYATNQTQVAYTYSSGAPLPAQSWMRMGVNGVWGGWVEMWSSYGVNSLVTDTGSIGFGTGSGGTVAQATSKTTGVTLNKPSGQITTASAALTANTAVSFVLTNNKIAANDIPKVVIKSGATAGAYVVTVDAVAAGSCRISIRNMTAGSLSETLVLQFNIEKGATA